MEDENGIRRFIFGNVYQYMHLQCNDIHVLGKQLHVSAKTSKKLRNVKN